MRIITHLLLEGKKVLPLMMLSSKRHLYVHVRLTQLQQAGQSNLPRTKDET